MLSVLVLERLHLEISVDEAVYVAVHNGVDVAVFKACAVILGEGVGHEDIGADLAAPANLFLVALDILYLVEMLALFYLEELRFEHPHGDLAVLMLAALDLAGDDDAGRDMRYTHGGRGLVDLLTARAARAVGVDFKIVGIYFNFDIVIS